jgi:hypothetical protein
MTLSKVRLFLVVAVACLGLSVLRVDSRADGGVPFSNRDLVGSYAVQLNEVVWTPEPSSVKLDTDAVGVVSFDGNGNASGTLVVNIGGTFQSIPQTVCTGTLTATYSVNADGTGTFNDKVVYSGGCLPTSTATHSLVLGNHGRTVFLAVTTPVTSGSQIGTITLIRQ